MRSPEMKSCLFFAVLLLAASGCGTEQSTSELASTPDLVSAPPSHTSPFAGCSPDLHTRANPDADIGTHC